MSPTIIVDAQGSPRLVLGAAGGTKIPTGVANVILNNLWFGKNIKEAVDARRIHHQLFPMSVMYESGFQQVTKHACASFMLLLIDINYYNI